MTKNRRVFSATLGIVSLVARKMSADYM